MATGRQYHVTLHIFSGREDPTWIIPAGEHHDKTGGHLQEFRGGQLPERLGYRGFTILEKEKDGTLIKEHTIPASVHSELEKYLLDTAGGVVEDVLKDVVRAAQPMAAPVAAEVQQPSTGNPTEPEYEPGKWDNNLYIKLNNNCYNYANNMRTNTFAQPGRASGHPVRDFDMSGPAYKRAAEYDGLKSVSAGRNVPATTGENHLVALVYSSSLPDFHWYRRAPDGWWSHKPGVTAVTDKDNSGQKISDPRSCDRGPYGKFVGFMTSNPAEVEIK